MSTKIWARVANNIAVELISLDATLRPGIDIFTASLTFMDVTAVSGIAVGWVYSGSAWAAPVAIVPPVPELAAALKAAASTACAALTAQIVPDVTHQNAYVNAAAMVGPSATVPTVPPVSTAFGALASAFGQQPQAFATLVVAISAASQTLSAILTTLSTAASAATTSAQLASALAAFEASLASLVTSINAAGLTVAVVAPAAISIVGINA
jgi:hypothetical protein